jgi:MFS family permease
MTEELEFQRQVETNFRWNFAVNTLDLSFYSFGFTLVSQATVLPLLVSHLTSSKLLIGLIPATYSLGYLLPQLLTANFAESLRRKLPFLTLVGGLVERTPFLLIGLVLWLLAKPSPTITLVAFFLLLAMTAAGNGLCNPAWYDMIAKAIPVKRRGLWAGVSNSLGAFMGIAGAAVAGRLLVEKPFPDNFALCFLLTSAAMLISWFGLASNREAISPTFKPVIGLGKYFRQLPAVLRRDRNYVRFLIGRSVANLGGMAAGFFMVYGVERFSLGGADAGALTAVMVVSQALVNLLLGYLADRRGHKLVLMLGTFMMALSAIAAWLASSPAWLYVAFALLGAALAADTVSGMNIILEFCAPEDRPTYIGLTNTLLAPAKTLSPILGGWLATLVGYPPMFLVALVVSVLGGLLYAIWVREPRHIPQLGLRAN